MKNFGRWRDMEKKELEGGPLSWEAGSSLAQVGEPHYGL